MRGTCFSVLKIVAALEHIPKRLVEIAIVRIRAHELAVSKEFGHSLAEICYRVPCCYAFGIVHT